MKELVHTLVYMPRKLPKWSFGFLDPKSWTKPKKLAGFFVFFWRTSFVMLWLIPNTQSEKLLLRLMLSMRWKEQARFFMDSVARNFLAESSPYGGANDQFSQSKPIFSVISLEFK